MEFLRKIKLIQGGMGVYVSNWRLAKAVALETPGITAGTVSGTALDVVCVRMLQLGDPGGHIRRALSAFDEQYGVSAGQKIFDRYYVEGGKAPSARFKSAPRQIARVQNGVNVFPLMVEPVAPTTFTLGEDVIELLIISAYAEVWLAKEGHSGNIFINFLNKVELPLIYAMYGAMLAGVDGIVVGAGNPDGLPAICTRLANHEVVTRELVVLYREPSESFLLSFNPQDVLEGRLTKKPLRRPAFLAIVSLANQVKALAESQSEAPNGFIIEHHTAGGHNAGPQGPLRLDEKGQPIYGSADEPDLPAIRQAGLPFWLAGGYGSRDKLQQALEAGAVGVQVGSLFALTEESGMKADYRVAIFDELKKETDEAALVQTTQCSPTGFPFKVVQLKGTLSDNALFAARRRVCDLGFLQQHGLSKAEADGTRQLFQRCPAAPVEDFVKKRGLPFNTEGRRCLCNGLLACVGLGQAGKTNDGERLEEPAIVTLGNHLDGIRRLSRHGQSPYRVRDVVADILATG